MTAGGVAGHGLNLRQTRPQTESTAGSGPALSHFRECPSPTDVPATLRIPAEVTGQSAPPEQAEMEDEAVATAVQMASRTGIGEEGMRFYGIERLFELSQIPNLRDKLIQTPGALDALLSAIGDKELWGRHGQLLAIGAIGMISFVTDTVQRARKLYVVNAGGIEVLVSVATDRNFEGTVFQQQSLEAMWAIFCAKQVFYLILSILRLKTSRVFPCRQSSNSPLLPSRWQTAAAVLDHPNFMGAVSAAISVLRNAATPLRVRLSAAGLLHALAHFGTVEAEDDLGFGPGPLRLVPAAAAAAERRRHRLRDAGALEAAVAAMGDPRAAVEVCACAGLGALRAPAHRNSSCALARTARLPARSPALRDRRYGDGFSAFWRWKGTRNQANERAPPTCRQSHRPPLLAPAAP